MKFDWRLSNALAGTAIVIVSQVVVQPPIVVALTGAEVSKVAKEFTVMIDTQSPGSGVIIGKKGKNYYVLTAWHVVQYGDWKYTVQTVDEKRYPIDYSKVKRIPGVDLAILQFTSNQNYSVAKFASEQITEGTPVYIAGFPDPGTDIKERIYKFTSGEISALYPKPLPGGYTLVYTNITLTGFSGSPVVDADGRLVGIHGQGETGDSTGTKTGFNMGIPIKTFLDLAPKAGINLNFDKSPAIAQQQIYTSPSPSEAPANTIPAAGAVPSRPTVVKSSGTTDAPICAGNRC